MVLNMPLWKLLCASQNNTAGNIKTLSKKLTVKENWNDIKLSVMEKCLKQKFNQEPYKTKLI